MENELTERQVSGEDVKQFYEEYLEAPASVRERYSGHFGYVSSRLNALLRSKQQAAPLLAKLKELRDKCKAERWPNSGTWLASEEFYVLTYSDIIKRLDAIINEAVSESENGQEH